MLKYSILIERYFGTKQSKAKQSRAKQHKTKRNNAKKRKVKATQIKAKANAKQRKMCHLSDAATKSKEKQSRANGKHCYMC